MLVANHKPKAAGIRRWLLIVAALLAVSCGGRKPISVGAIDILSAQGTTSEGAGEWQLPSHLMVRAEIDNDGAKVKVQQGRVRVSYGGRRVVMLSLTEPVTLPARQRSAVMLPLRIAFARNSQSIPLREAVRRKEWQNIGVDWEVKARRCGVNVTISRDDLSASDVLTPDQQEALWQMLF